MKSFAKWLKKNLFYVILFLVVAIALTGYEIWFRQPMDVIPKDAENLSIQTTGYAIEGNPYVYVDVIYEKYPDGSDVTEHHAVMLTDEGQQKLLDAMRGQKMRATTSDLSGVERELGRFSFSVNFDLNGVNYNRYIYCYNKIQVINGWRPNEDGAKPKFDPSRRFNTIITGPNEADTLYYTVIDIIQNYAASDIILTPTTQTE